MLKLAATLALGALGLLTGCAPMVSLHPLVQDDDAALVDLGYVGLWTECDDVGSNVWKVEANGERAYRYRSLAQDSGWGEARVVELEGARFVDVWFKSEDQLVPAHILAKMRLDGDTLYFAFLADAPTAKALPHETVGSGDSQQVILTASTADLRKFLLSVHNQSAFFNKEMALCRLK
jgi:hypothetical protein